MSLYQYQLYLPVPFKKHQVNRGFMKDSGPGKLIADSYRVYYKSLISNFLNIIICKILLQVHCFFRICPSLVLASGVQKFSLLLLMLVFMTSPEKKVLTKVNFITVLSHSLLIKMTILWRLCCIYFYFFKKSNSK